MRRTQREVSKGALTVQASECEDFVLVPVSLLKSLRAEIDELRDSLGLPKRLWETPLAVDAVRQSME